MIEWAKKHLETVLGKTITGLIGIFLLGVATAWILPKYLVTTEVFKEAVKHIYSDMETKDNWRELWITEVKIDLCKRQQSDLSKIIDKQQDKRPTLEQQNQLEDIKKELDYLRSKVRTLTDELER